MSDIKHYLKMFKTSWLNIPQARRVRQSIKRMERAFHRDRHVTDQRLCELSYLNG